MLWLNICLRTDKSSVLFVMSNQLFNRACSFRRLKLSRIILVKSSSTSNRKQNLLAFVHFVFQIIVKPFFSQFLMKLSCNRELLFLLIFPLQKHFCHLLSFNFILAFPFMALKTFHFYLFKLQLFIKTRLNLLIRVFSFSVIKEKVKSSTIKILHFIFMNRHFFDWSFLVFYLLDRHIFAFLRIAEEEEKFMNKYLVFCVRLGLNELFLIWIQFFENLFPLFDQFFKFP